MRIVVEGCAHGDLDRIYNDIQSIEQKQGKSVDLLICCGDFQSTRNLTDLQCMAIPVKYLDMCSFYKYYSGEKVAPILTIFIGGNHEASNYLQELAYGGWVAPNIYYLGYAGFIVVNGVKIGGISGIFRGNHFEKGHFEFAPYDEGTKRSVYGIRSLEVFRLSQLSGSFDIMLSHDWPKSIWEHGNKEQLLRLKPYFRKDMDNGRLGSGPCWDLLTSLKPKHWYAAHLHCSFDASVQHENHEFTRFVALDKCLPNRKFLDFLTIGEDDDGEAAAADRKMPDIQYDLEWLTVLHLTNNLLNVTKNYTKLSLQPGPDHRQGNVQRFKFTPSKEETDAVLKKFNGDLKIPKNFTQTLPAYDPQRDGKSFRNLHEQIIVELNPQTTSFCEKLGLDDPLFLAAKFAKVDLNTAIVNLAAKSSDQPINLASHAPVTARAPLASFLPQPKFANDEEIDLDELENDDETATEEKVDETVKDDPQVVEASIPESQNPDSSAPLGLSSRAKPTEAPEDSTDGPTPSKKFKRRNQETYTADDDE